MRISKLKTTVARLRNMLELKTPEFSEITGLGLSTIEKLETGRLKLSETVAVRIALATGVSVDWLLAGDIGVDPLAGSFDPNSNSIEIQPYTRKVFDEIQAGIKSGGNGAPVSAREIYGRQDARLNAILHRAMETGQDALVAYKVNRALDELEEQFGISKARQDAEEDFAQHIETFGVMAGQWEDWNLSRKQQVELKEWAYRFRDLCNPGLAALDAPRHNLDTNGDPAS